MQQNQPAAAPKKTKRARQAQETKERIYSCADRLFQEKGFDGTTIADIAAAADISVGLFYYHFKNKEEIIRLWIKGLDDQYQDYYDRELCGPQMQAADALFKIRLLMRKVNELFFSHGTSLSRNAYALMIREASIGSMNTNPDRAYYRIIHLLVEEAFQQGRVRAEYTVEKIAATITILSRGCKVEWLLSNCVQDLIEMEDGILADYLKIISQPSA